MPPKKIDDVQKFTRVHSDATVLNVVRLSHKKRDTAMMIMYINNQVG